MFRANPRHSYLMEMEEFNSILLEDFVNSYGKTLLLLGDGVFVDAHYLKRKLGNQLYIQRILNMYQFQKTIVEDFYYDDFSIFIVVRLSELKEWKEDVLLNIYDALEEISRRTETPSIVYLVTDEEFRPYWIDNVFHRKIFEVVKRWEETPLASEWK
ncbi:MAG: hypothetical protein M1290_03795 [Candidatus Thermoplasmatota archaeon]|jgi:hypothetical protein|nr:hypothetical protein [Candidatus Thermoplasmatota archaeon]MCL5789572.1 hypothetical protein [Candidatus Thermoplasmatota archaeon]